MALRAPDVLTPRGRLNAKALWPGVEQTEIEQTVGQYLQEGYEKAVAIEDDTLDEAARQWAYYRSWDEVYQRLLAMPSTVNTSDEGGSSYLLTQIEHIGEMATEALGKFEALVAAATVVEVSVVPVTRMSFSAPARFAF